SRLCLIAVVVCVCSSVFFFFQAEDGIRDATVTGVQTCALPISSAAKVAYDTAFACVRPAGTLLAVGLPAENISFPPILMAAKEVRIQASAVGTRQDLREVLALAGRGKIHCHVTTHPLSDVNRIMDRLRQGQVPGRVVLLTQSIHDPIYIGQ